LTLDRPHRIGPVILERYGGVWQIIEAPPGRRVVGSFFGFPQGRGGVLKTQRPGGGNATGRIVCTERKNRHEDMNS
jgi:hypothetical protein